MTISFTTSCGYRALTNSDRVIEFAQGNYLEKNFRKHNYRMFDLAADKQCPCLQTNRRKVHHLYLHLYRVFNNASFDK